MRDTHREREIEAEPHTGRGRSRLHAESLTWDSIPGLQDHAPDQRQASPEPPRDPPKRF